MVQNFRQRLLKQFILLSVSLGIPLLVCLIVLSSMVPRARIGTLSQATAAQIAETMSTNLALNRISLNPQFSIEGHRLQTQPVFFPIANKARDALVRRTENAYFREILEDFIAKEIQLIMIPAELGDSSQSGIVVAALDSQQIGATFNYDHYDDELIHPLSSRANLGSHDSESGNRWTAFAPVFDTRDQTVAMVVVHSDATLITRLDWSGGLFAFLLVAAVIGLSIYFASRVSKRIHHPIKTLHDGMLELASGNLGVTLSSPNTGDEFDDLIRHFNKTSLQLKERLSMLNAMEMAAEIQAKLLPSEYPEIRHYEIAASLNYAELAGGDYYDFILLASESDTNKKWIMVVGDVTGHGVSAALLVAWLRATIRVLAREYKDDLVSLVDKLNASMLQDMNTGKFVTLFFAIVESKSNQINWLSAGHDPVRLYSDKESAPQLLEASGPPVGVVTSANWLANEPVELDDHMVLLVLTDGLQDAKDEEGQRLGIESIDRSVSVNLNKSAKGIQQALVERMDVHRAGAKLADDVTLLVIKRIP